MATGHGHLAEVVGQGVSFSDLAVTQDMALVHVGWNSSGPRNESALGKEHSAALRDSQAPTASLGTSSRGSLPACGG